MFRYSFGLIALSGCQVLFSVAPAPLLDGPGEDAVVDADLCAAGHDEDNDSKIDACDNCPTEPNADQMLDADGDQVGLACDPFPTQIDRIAFYRGFFADESQLENQVQIKNGSMLDGSGDGAVILDGSSTGEVASVNEVSSPKAIRVKFEVLGVTTMQTLQVQLGTTGAFCGISIASPGVGCTSGVCVRVDADSNLNSGVVGADLGNFGMTTEIELIQDVFPTETRIRCTAGGQTVIVTGTLSKDTVRVSTTGPADVAVKSLIVYEGESTN